MASFALTKMPVTKQEPTLATHTGFNADYWANQPEPVRQLEYMTDSKAREDLARQLVAEGYPIDWYIQVWGNDPEKTMRHRSEGGMTWVPEASQKDLLNNWVGPGLNFPGRAPYDPANPPAGSIPVTDPSLGFSSGGGGGATAGALQESYNPVFAPPASAEVLQPSTPTLAPPRTGGQQSQARPQAQSGGGRGDPQQKLAALTSLLGLLQNKKSTGTSAAGGYTAPTMGSNYTPVESLFSL